MKSFSAERFPQPLPKNLKEAEQDEFLGTKHERSRELTKEEVAEWVNRMTSAMYRGDVKKTAEVAGFLMQTNQTIDLYHRLSTESAAANWVAETERKVSRSSVQDQYFGQGIYWGVNEPYHWIHEDDLGECYILRNVPIRDVFLAYSSGQVMALMPVHKLSCDVEEDEASQATLSTFLQDTHVIERREGGKKLVFHDDVPDTRLVYSSEHGYVEDEETKTGEEGAQGAYLEVKRSQKDAQDAAWWKSYIPPGSHWETNPFPNTETLDEIDGQLGIMGVEYVDDDPDIHESFLRIYVKEKRALLCMSVAAAARLAEVVFGDNPNRREMWGEALDRGTLMSLKDWKAQQQAAA